MEDRRHGEGQLSLPGPTRFLMIFIQKKKKVACYIFVILFPNPLVLLFLPSILGVVMWHIQACGRVILSLDMVK